MPGNFLRFLYMLPSLVLIITLWDASIMRKLRHTDVSVTGRESLLLIIDGVDVRLHEVSVRAHTQTHTLLHILVCDVSVQ